MTLEELRALRVAGRGEDHLAAAKVYVAEHPDDPAALAEAGFAHDRMDLEREACRYYDAAFQLGVPPELRRKFLICYGSTLRNVGRLDDAVGILGQAVQDDPTFPAAMAFLALALYSAGQPREALAAMLSCALDAARPGVFEGFERALGEYHQLLLAGSGLGEPPSTT
jgi:tetratricopeptide (TPR) repeat protein